jgi:tellurite resistance protein TehA-like permease
MKAAIKNVPPGIFALVMATGMLSLAAHMHHTDAVSRVLFFTMSFFFLLLVIVLVLRCLLFYRVVAQELSSIGDAAGFLTFTAGCAVLGNNVASMFGLYPVARGLCLVAFFTWVFLIYSILLKVSVSGHKQTEKNMDGSWLLFTVATQSIVILLTTLLPHMGSNAHILLFLLMAGFCAAAFFYFTFATLILHRLFFAGLPGKAISPTFWILMGAGAITALAATGLGEAVKPKPEFADLFPAFRMLGLMFWGIASVWIPFVLILDVWKFTMDKNRFRYGPSVWSLVFPLAMYSVASQRLQSIFPMLFLQKLSVFFLTVALVAWVIAFAGMLINAVKSIASSAGKQESS